MGSAAARAACDGTRRAALPGRPFRPTPSRACCSCSTRRTAIDLLTGCGEVRSMLTRRWVLYATGHFQPDGNDIAGVPEDMLCDDPDSVPFRTTPHDRPRTPPTSRPSWKVVPSRCRVRSRWTPSRGGSRIGRNPWSIRRTCGPPTLNSPLAAPMVSCRSDFPGRAPWPLADARGGVWRPRSGRLVSPCWGARLAAQFVAGNGRGLFTRKGGGLLRA